MSRRIVIATTVVIVLTGLFATNVGAATSPKPPSPQAPLVGSCGVWANNPVRSGSNVIGQAGVSCNTTYSWLEVVAELQDWTGRHTSTQKYCYGVSSCSATATLSYSSGRQWMTMVSGYAWGGWQAYYQTSWISIP